MNTMRTDIATLQSPTKEQAQSQKGSVLVEFALILPVFMIFLAGIVDISLILYNKTMLTMATREGARAGAMYGTADRINTAREVALDFCENKLISFGSETTPTVTCNPPSTYLTVSARYHYTGLLSFPHVSIPAQTIMMLE